MRFDAGFALWLWVFITGVFCCLRLCWCTRVDCSGGFCYGCCLSGLGCCIVYLFWVIDLVASLCPMVLTALEVYGCLRLDCLGIVCLRGCCFARRFGCCLICWCFGVMFRYETGFLDCFIGYMHCGFGFWLWFVG